MDQQSQYQEQMKRLKLQEEGLQFEKFTNHMALEVGLLLLEEAKSWGNRLP